MRRAVIDVGSNSVLLLVAEHRDGNWLPVLETTDVTSLGAGTKETGFLSGDGMAKTLHALRMGFQNAQQLGATQVVAAATMAARIATNTSDFLAEALRNDTPVSVLSGEDEADLGFQAVADDPHFASEDRLTIIDPGGQSTELVTASRNAAGWTRTFRKSFPIGTLGLRGGVLSNEALDPQDIFRGVHAIDEIIGLEYRPDEAGRAIVLGATGTNLITIRDEIVTWDPARVHGAYLDYEEVSKAFGRLAAMSDVERSQVVGMEHGREKTIHIGTLILERFLHAIKVLGCTVSVRGWRHALLADERLFQREYGRARVK